MYTNGELSFEFGRETTHFNIFEAKKHTVDGGDG